jgi:hypothetical protein
MSEIDPETMSLEELRALANAKPEAVLEPAVEQPRNADGTFAAVVPPIEEPLTPTTFSRTIDLGDGSGKQVFTAETLEGLVDKLTDAQTHATRKIRELSQVAKLAPKAPAKKELTADEEYVLGQRFISEPSKAMRELLEVEYGMSFEDIKNSAAQARQITQERVDTANANAWLEKNPAFFNNDYNGRKIRQYVSRFCEGGMTQENLDTAYAELKTSELLQEKPADAVAIVPAVVAAAAPKARASSLSARVSTVAPLPTGPTLDEAYKMPMDQLYELANKRG